MNSPEDMRNTVSLSGTATFSNALPGGTSTQGSNALPGTPNQGTMSGTMSGTPTQAASSGTPIPEGAPHAGQQQLPFAFARAHGVLLDLTKPQLTVVHRPGMNVAILGELSRKYGPGLQLLAISESAFARQLARAYSRSDSEAVQMAQDMGADVNLDRLADDIPATGDLMEGEDSAPVIKLINALISQAVRERASDIHIETFEESLSVRFRTDGVLREVLAPKRVLAPLLVSRIKIMARLDIAEKRLPQDGRISVKLAGHALDIRVSTLPSAHGERVVLRLLDKQGGQLELEQLQMPAAVLQAWREVLALPHGIILLTGPTGSGKTTTLYAGLMHINDGQQNILTIEDPVEYTLPGVGQTQVNTRVGLNFASGLRSILRQDPDVVMLGEIRDAESAAIAVQASLTGHLVLSTLHTNTAVGAITRLQDMGIEPFLLASSLAAVVSQRLVRLLCVHCRQPYLPDAREAELAGLGETGQHLYRPAGCSACRNTGYQHRRAIFECIRIDDTIRALIHDGGSEQTLLAAARVHSRSLHEDGLRCVREGLTSLAEVLRVTVG